MSAVHMKTIVVTKVVVRTPTEVFYVLAYLDIILTLI